MQYIRNYLSEELHFTKFQIAQIKYFLAAISSEVSKFIIMGIFFFYLGRFNEYIFAVATLLLIRIFSGGIHFKHYISCFAMSFAIMYTGICILPVIPTTNLIQMVCLLPCLLCHYTLAPVVSCYRPVPDGVKVRKAKLTSSTMICFYIILLYIIPQNTCTTAGFWIIILQSVQLAVAKLLKRREQNEKLQNEKLHEEMDVYSM